MSLAYGAKGKVKVEWKWFRGPFPPPRPGAVLIAASTYREADLTACGTFMPFARFDAIAAKREISSTS